MASERGEDRLICRRVQHLPVPGARPGCRAIGTPLDRSVPLRQCVFTRRATLGGDHPAMMSSSSSATCGQTGLRALRQSESGSKKRKAEHSQQQNGNKPTQLTSFEHRNLFLARTELRYVLQSLLAQMKVHGVRPGHARGFRGYQGNQYHRIPHGRPDAQLPQAFGGAVLSARSRLRPFTSESSPPSPGGRGTVV